METQLLVAEKLEYISKAEAERVLKEVSEIGKMIHGLLSKLFESDP